MSAPFVTMAAAVDIVQTGRDRLEARGRKTEQLLGTASRSGGHHDDEWIGWLVECGAHRQVVATVTTARFVLLNEASALLDGTR